MHIFVPLWRDGFLTAHAGPSPFAARDHRNDPRYPGVDHLRQFSPYGRCSGIAAWASVKQRTMHTGAWNVTLIIWLFKGAGVRGGSIYGVTDEAKQAPGMPTVPKGHWERVRLVNEDRFPGAAEAKLSIKAHGYYIFGGELTITETEEGSSRKPG